MTDAHSLEAALGIVAYFLVFLVFLVPVVRLFATRGVADDLNDLLVNVTEEKGKENALARRSEGRAVTFDPAAQRVGDAYVRWLRSRIAANGDLEDATAQSFETELRKTIPRCVVAGIDRGESGGIEIRDDADLGSGWIVIDGNEVLAVPRPLPGGRFSLSSTTFEGAGTAPAAVRRVVAARLEVQEDGSHFTVAAKGLLSEVERESAIESDADVRTLGALESDRYSSPLVREAVQQVAAAYPGGDYRRFDLLRLPTHAEYSERMGTARSMAGLFVIVGLGLTMLRLNSVVGEIASAAGEQGMSPDAFIAKMGTLMGNIGGAFTASIWGLSAMVLTLIVLSLMDRAMQRRFARIEHVVSDEVLPLLVQIQERDMPSATLPAVLRATQKNIERLDETVQGLTAGMAASLNGMGTRITDLLEQLGTYQKRSSDLDTMLRDVAGTAAQLGTVVHKLDAAATRMTNPMERLVEVIAAPLDQMAGAVASVEAGYASVGAEMSSLRQHLNAATDRTEALMAASAAQQREQLAAIGSHLKGFSEGARELGPVARSFAQAATAQSAATRELQVTSQRLSGTGQTLQRAAEQFQRHGPAIVPPSMFAWFYNGTITLWELVTGQKPGGWSRFDGPRGDGASVPAPQAPQEQASPFQKLHALPAATVTTMDARGSAPEAITTSDS